MRQEIYGVMTALIALMSQDSRRFRGSFVAGFYSCIQAMHQHKTPQTNRHVIFPHAARRIDVQVERGFIKRGKAEVAA
jgi:hypothetical protein